MTGRKPKPFALKLLEGRGEGRDSGGRKVKPVPTFIRLPPEPPEWRSAEARAEWERVVPLLQELGRTKPQDRAALTAYCESWAMFVAATVMIADEGMTVVNRSVRRDGTVTTWSTKHPAVDIQKSAHAGLKKWCAEFGMTPSSDGRMSAT
jgi:P27 family predicted phage terminase small subunit